MIKVFVDRYMERKELLKTLFAKNKPDCYHDIVKLLISAITYNECDDDELEFECDGNMWHNPDPKRVHEINDGGHYRGTLLYVVAEKGSQPSVYWSVKVWYGSCSGCDTLERLMSDYRKEIWEKAEYHMDGDTSYDIDYPEQLKGLVDGYMTLALHLVQGLRLIGDEE